MKTSSNPYLFLVRNVWEYAGAYRGKFILALALLATGQAIWLFQPYILGIVFNLLQKGGKEIFPPVLGWLSLYAFLGFFSWVFWKPGRQIERIVAFHVRRSFFDRHYKYIKELPLRWHQDHHSGDTINRVRLAGESLYSFTESQFLYVTSIMSFLGPLTAIILIAPEIALTVIIASCITLYILWRFDQILIPLFETENELLHKFAAVFFDYVSNIKTVITLHLGERTREELGKTVDVIFPTFNRQIRIHETKYLAMTVCNTLITLSVLSYFIWKQLNAGSGIIALGTTIAVFQYISTLASTFFNFANDYQQIVRWRTNFRAAHHVFESHAASGRQRVDVDSIPWEGAAIRNLNFRYNSDKDTLDNISFSFRKGEKIALVGESGSGKSTLMALIRGLYEPDSALLELDGISYHTLLPLFAMTTLIPQEPEIFENSIRYNVTFGIDYGEEDIIEALRLACFTKVLQAMPRGLETDMRERGVTLSGGERQRLALARGILAARNSDIILMDEPTSSIDAYNESQIYKNLFAHFEGKTVISSIHRLHLLERFDRIIVMERGRVAQNGTLEGLMKEEGIFQTLWVQYNNSSKESL